MKRVILLAALAAFVPGCADGGQSINSPFSKVDPSKKPKKADYFEVKKKGATYVLSSPDSLKKLNAGQNVNLKTMTGYGPKGETVAFENNGYTDLNRLIAEYRKSHNLP